MGGNLIVTVYQTSGTCDVQAMQQFVQQFLGQVTSAAGMGGATGTGTGSSTGTGSGSTGSGTGSATPTP
jgi:hypothetical protein